MKVDNFVKSILKLGIVDEGNLITSITEHIDTINLQQYKELVLICKQAQIDADIIFNSLINKVNEDVQYQMWKDGYGNLCPVDKLLEDIKTENPEIVKLIHKDYNVNLPHIEAYFENIQNEIIKHISQAKQSLKIAMAWFTNPIIFNALLRACKRDIEVHLLINNDSINNRVNGLPFNKLIQEGSNFSLYIAESPDLIHNKFCIIDDRIVIDGSYNWTVLAETNNDENIVIIENSNVISSFIEAFKNLTENRGVSEMPDTVPQRLKYECCSYSDYYNSEEWLILADRAGKKKKRELFKEIYKTLSEDLAKDMIPSDIFDSVKDEVEEEITRDVRLYKASVNQKSEELVKEFNIKERKIDSLSQDVLAMERQKTDIIRKFSAKVEALKMKRLSPARQELKMDEIIRNERKEITKINKTIKKQNADIETLKSELELISNQKSFINSIQETDLKGSNGLFRINLKWNTEDDLDLHLVLPNGLIDSNQDIYYSNLSLEYNGGLCSLDHDAIPKFAGENPQENIIWEKKLPDGQYEVFVKLYNKRSANNLIPFSITTFTRNYANTGLFNFVNAQSQEIIHIMTLTFKNGRVVTPIVFDSVL